MKLKIEKIFLFFTIFFLLFYLLPIKQSFGANAPVTQITSQPSTNGTASLDQLNNLKNEVEKLRDENYQTIIRSSQQTIDKSDQYANRITTFATIFGAILTIFGVFIAIITIFFSVNFSSVKKEFAEQLKEIKNYVASAKKNAELVNKLVVETKKQTQTIPQIIKDFQKNRNDMTQLLTKAKKVKSIKVKEFDDALTRIQEKESELSQRLLRTVNNIQTMNSQATILSGSVSLSPSASLSASDLPKGTTEFVDFPTIQKCSNCNKPLSLNDLALDNQYIGAASLENLCSDCEKLKNIK